MGRYKAQLRSHNSFRDFTDKSCYHDRCPNSLSPNPRSEMIPLARNLSCQGACSKTDPTPDAERDVCIPSHMELQINRRMHILGFKDSLPLAQMEPSSSHSSSSPLLKRDLNRGQAVTFGCQRTSWHRDQNIILQRPHQECCIPDTMQL